MSSRGVFDNYEFELVKGKWGRDRELDLILLVIFLMEVSLGAFLFSRDWTSQRNNHQPKRVSFYPSSNDRTSSKLQAEIYPAKDMAGEFNVSAKEKDKRVVEIDNWLSERNSPLAGYGSVLIEEEDDKGIYNLHKLIIAISGAESSLGKVCPSHNAWGIKCGRTTYCTYDNWSEGIKAISSLLASDTYSLGEEADRADIQRIASTYAESSRWPSLVTYFWDRL